MQDAFLKFIDQKKLCKSTDKILVAVSGGLDSMALLRLFHEVGFSVAVAHANFQLRGAESDGDEQFVAHYCKQRGIPFFGNRFDTNNYAKANGLSVQMAARELRYAWFSQLIQSHGFDCVATAHHANDNTETMLLNLTKGAGIDGLTGIEPRNGNIIRPLLFASRSQIEEYAAHIQLPWREDESNTQSDYERNKIRHAVIPTLEQINPALQNAIARSTEKLKGVEHFAEAGLAHWKNMYVREVPGQILISKSGVQNIPVGAMYHYLKAFGLNWDQCQQIAAATHQQPGKRFSVPEYELIIDRDNFVLYSKSNFEPLVIAEVDMVYRQGKQEMHVRQLDEAFVSTQPRMATLDADKVQLPLTWRKWVDGDVFYPLGMNQKKKLSDFFIDQKLSLADKDSATVVESNGQIIWVVGHRIDDRFKITDTTQRTIILDCQF
jgi:tRNA(Ile)-lysidine synthase